MRFALFLAAFVASGAAQQQALWEQCGGAGWTGSTQCVAGAACQPINDLYSQCAPSTEPRAVETLTTKASSPATLTGVTAPPPPVSRIRVGLNPENVRPLEDGDFELWSLGSDAAPSKTFGNVTFSLSVPTDATWHGGWFKFGYSKFLSSMGERLVNQGLSTETGGSAITLSITGLAAGPHSLLCWHNAWDKLAAVATLTIAVNGAQAASGVAQTVRVDNIWEAGTSHVTFNVTSAAQTVQIQYTPDSQGDARAFLNGFELDGPAAGNRIMFPSPEHRDERVILSNGSVVASWRAPASASGPRYDVYLGTSATTLRSVSLGQTDTQVTLAGLDTVGTYYWRVDVVSGGAVHVGQVFMFRAAQLAFPGAEGWGRYARGGRGGKVVKVTSLADDTSPGTLRHALTLETGPRTVVFDVGGIITLTSRLTLNGQYVTVAGQTAPGKGIVIQGMPFGLSGATDVIIRHVRVRTGKVSGKTVDGMGAQGSNHCIFDRCSVGWSIDEAFSSRAAHNITFQRSMISEPLNVAGHENYPNGTAHGYAATIGGDVGSFHHNLIAHAEGRSWSMGGGLDAKNEFAGRLDIRNNVVYNFGGRVTDGGAKAVNFVGNLYKRGPASKLNYALRATYEDNFGGAQQYHCAGNSMPGAFTQDSVQYPSGNGTSVNANIACWADVSFTPAPTYQRFFPNPFFESHVETQSSTEAYKRVLSDSGASQPVFDDHDKRIVRETLSGTTTYVGSQSGKKGLIDHPDDAGGLEPFPSTTRPADWDADDDGIADWWDGSTGGGGYTPLEGYLNFMAEPHAFVAPSATVSIDLAALAAGFTNPVFQVSGATKGTVSASGTSATYQAGAATGIDYFDIAIQDTEGSTWTRRFGVVITA